MPKLNVVSPRAQATVISTIASTRECLEGGRTVIRAVITRYAVSVPGEGDRGACGVNGQKNSGEHATK
jgi:hypothetical protein